MRPVVLVFALLLIAAPAFAQIHPCDIPTTNAGAGTVEAGKPYTIGWCQPATEDGVTFIEYRGTTATPLVAVSGTVSASGYRQYFVSNRVEKATGTVTIQLAAVRNGSEGDKSAPFTLTVMQPRPSAPTGVRVTQ